MHGSSQQFTGHIEKTALHMLQKPAVSSRKPSEGPKVLPSGSGKTSGTTGMKLGNVFTRRVEYNAIVVYRILK